MGGIVDCKKQELQDLDRRTRKLLTMKGGFHPQDCIKRLYVPRKEGGRGVISVEDVTAASFKERRRTENTQGWKEMALYGQFARQSEDQRNDETWTWLKEGKLKRETESRIIAAQDQAPMAQLVEHRAVTREVVSSTPAGPTLRVFK